MQSQPAPLKGFVSYNKCSLLNESCEFCTFLGIYVPPRDLQSPYPAYGNTSGDHCSSVCEKGPTEGQRLKNIVWLFSFSSRYPNNAFPLPRAENKSHVHLELLLKMSLYA